MVPLTKARSETEEKNLINGLENNFTSGEKKHVWSVSFSEARGD